MKKLFTLVAMAFMAVGANAQAVIAEIDWTTQSAYYEGVWFDNERATVEVNADGLVIETLASVDGTGNYWEPQVPMIAHIPELTEGGQYQVKFTVNAPAAGSLRLDFCSWTEGAKTTQEWIGDVVAGDNEITADFADYPGATTDAMIFYQCGKIPGKHIVKNVQVIDLEGQPGPGPQPGGDGVIAEIDWTTQSAYYEGVWFDNERATVEVNADGLVIETLASVDGTGNYWEPQVPMIAHIPELTEGGQYQVQFQFNSPVAGSLRLDFCSWTEGAKTTQEWIGDVVAGDNDITADFADYPGATTDAMIFYQCGKLPGKHIVKKVKVIDLEGSGIKNVKANKVANNVRYNLAGQKVDASYKGIVIMNGKKFIQK